MTSVLQFIDTLDVTLGGPVRSIINLTRSLACIGVDVTLAVRDAGSQTAWEGRVPSARVVELGGRTLPGKALLGTAVRPLRDLVAESNVVHVHGVWSIATAQLASVCDAADVPMWLTPDGSLDDWAIAQKAWKKRTFLATIGRHTLRRTAVLHACSELEAVATRQYTKWHGVRTAVLPNPLDEQLFRAGATIRRRTSPERPTLLFLGRLGPGKGLSLVLRTLATLGGSPRPQLLIAGQGPASFVTKLERLAKTLGIEKQVEMLGFVDGTDKVELLAASDALLLASEHENYSHVCFEALAMRTPVVTVPTVMTWRELQSSGGAIVCQPHPTALAHGVSTLLSQGRGVSMGTAGRRWIEAHLEPSALARRYLREYRRVDASSEHRPRGDRCLIAASEQRPHRARLPRILDLSNPLSGSDVKG